MRLRRRRPFIEPGSGLPGSTLPRAMVAAAAFDFRVALVTAVMAVAALVVDTVFSASVHGPTTHQRFFAAGCAAGFLIFAVIAVRSVAQEMFRVLEPRTGPSHAGVVRWVILVFGYIVVLLTTLGLLDVPVQHLLVGGALTGVILGIAAQQSIGNIFAGVVLLLARPFSIGDAIRLRAGALGGELRGVVTGMGLTYLTLLTDEGPISLPNSVVLGSGIGPLPPPAVDPEPGSALEEKPPTRRQRSQRAATSKPAAAARRARNIDPVD